VYQAVTPCPLTLIGLRADFYDRADFSGDLRSYVESEGLELKAIYPFIGVLALTRVRFFPGRRFDFDDDGMPAAVCEVLASDAASPLDLVAWPVHRPDKFATALGVADGLGADQVSNPATYFADQHLAVHRTPLRWLQAACRGVVVLNVTSAPRWRGAAAGPIAGEDVNHARELARLLHPYFDPARILAPLAEAA
jgi:hypothetical protein